MKDAAYRPTQDTHWEDTTKTAIDNPTKMPDRCPPSKTPLMPPPPLPSESPKCGSGHMRDLGAQKGSAKAIARNNAPGGSTACATRAWWKHALLSYTEWKRCAQSGHFGSTCAQNAPGRSTMRPPEALLPRNPT